MLASEIEGLQIQLFIQCSSLALLYYDYALTFPDEKQYIWGSRFSLFTFLYIGCRYALVANIVFLLGVLNIIDGRCDTLAIDLWQYTRPLIFTSCNTGYLISGILSVIGRASVLSVWGLRTYALYNGNKLISIWMIILGLICFVTDAVHVAGNRCSGEALYPLWNDPFDRCLLF
ncbi:hypothetical protein M378DRAFT_357903 [Amanita muscaria Koide BX008]|uniref:DUF6533 domain-containing protein n=1 Tax=Amanita muscaria (strain Koide BX008) TaxID=946122 RepID=A0A0C2WNU9_AMAMK|nr:hypothetical protein M378DRAFT_357903 [Amanita muscaria Koide BX008]